MWAQRESAGGPTVISYRSDELTGGWQQCDPFLDEFGMTVRMRIDLQKL